MTRFKQELRRHGWKLETDIPFFPYHEQPESPALESIRAYITNDGFVGISKVYVVGTWHAKFDRNFNIIENDFD